MPLQAAGYQTQVGINSNNALVVFQRKDIRRIWHENEWFFSVVEALEASSISKRYWSDLKNKLKDEEGFEVYDFIVQLRLLAED